MAYSVPGLSRLISRAKADIESVLQNGGVYIRRSFESAVAKAQAGMSHTLHQHLVYVSRQILPDFAEDEFLVRWADIVLGENARLPASEATFDITVTGSVASTSIDDGTRWTRQDGAVFECSQTYTLPASDPLQVTVTVTAVEAGQAGNTVPGSTLTLETPIAGVDADAIVDGSGSAPIGGGADIEDIEALRQRVLLYLSSPPSGGGPGDYVQWALGFSSGVTRAWELPLVMGPGTVHVLFVQDTFDADGFYLDTIFPSAAEVEAVRAYIEALCPVTAVLTVAAPIEQPLNPEIQLSPNTAAVQEQVILQLEDLLLRRAQPGGTVELSRINEAISVASGEEDHVLVSPVADVVSTNAQLLTLGTPVFSAIP